MSTKIHATCDALENPTAFHPTLGQEHDLKDAYALIISAKIRKIMTSMSIKSRHPIENFFTKLKQNRGIATRYDKIAQNFLGAIYMAPMVILLN